MGAAWLSRIPVHGNYLTDIRSPSIGIAVVLGLASVSLTVASASGVPSRLAGVAGA
jgi:hypothetical protein